MGGAEFPPCWLFGLRWPSTGGYRLFGGANGRLREGSCQGVLPRTSAASVLVPMVSTATLYLCRRPCNTRQQVWFSLLWGHCSFSLGPGVQTTLCVPSKSGVSVYPSPVEVLQSNPTRLQGLILWEFLLSLPDPQVGKPEVGLRTFTPVGGLLWHKCSPVCESPTQHLRDLILLWLCPSYRLIVASPLSLDVGYLFGEFQCLPPNSGTPHSHTLEASLWMCCISPSMQVLLVHFCMFKSWQFLNFVCLNFGIKPELGTPKS